MTLSLAANHVKQYFGRDPLYKGGYAYGIEKLSDILAEIIPLHEEHWDETERPYLHTDMWPDYSRYLDLERAGQAVQFTARAANTRLAAQMIFTIAPHPHAMHKIVAAEQALYCHPDHRGRCVIRLLDYAEQSLWELGMDYIIINDKSPSGGADLEPLLSRQGFEGFAKSYIKRREGL